MHLIADDLVHTWWLIMGGLMGLISGGNKSIFQAAFGITWPLYHWHFIQELRLLSVYLPFMVSVNLCVD